MKVFLAVFLLLSIGACSSSQEVSEENLRLALNQFNNAFEKGDVQKLSSLLSPDYVHTNGSWKSFGKEQWLKYMQERSKKIEDGKLTIHSYEMDEVAIEKYEHSAIITTKITSEGLEDGVMFKKAFRVTNIWVHDGSRWLRAGFHDTVIE